MEKVDENVTAVCMFAWLLSASCGQHIHVPRGRSTDVGYRPNSDIFLREGIARIPLSPRPFSVGRTMSIELAISLVVVAVFVYCLGNTIEKTIAGLRTSKKRQ